MKLGSSAEIIMEALIPSWGELNVSLAIAIFCIICFGLLRHMEKLFGRDPASRPFPGSGHEGGILDGSSNKTNSAGLDLQSSYIYLVKLELLAAKDLIAANISGTSDPYAIIECGSEKRFSSMVPGTRNPIWGEDFELFIEELPSEVHVSIYDWDIIMKSSNLGSVTLKIEKECQTEAMWYSLGGRAGQVCIKMMTKRCVSNASGITDGLAGIIARKRLQGKPAGTEVLQKPGPLQTIFDLPPDEGVEHKFSCALERSFLYHGRMYVSSWHICFHSNVFSKQLKVVLPYEYIEEIKKSQHALINPAITIILRAGSGGIGVPPLASSDGRAKYMFASFWNRNHALRVLQRAANNFQKLEEEAKQVHFILYCSHLFSSSWLPVMAG
ncbi:hypothetical protein O6H91_07G005000 [Diphasiastrum complanatum]|uniref:Uncharacterized protein n=2 Tax=Diphasiastrum complanatum TaxID=34168 RepID=A0ACC2D1W8_DIPCM|nr:hypothetical protein O6H91_07G005000 [Diphasiastrum complanatum]